MDESYWTVSELAWVSCPPMQDTLLAVTICQCCAASPECLCQRRSPRRCTLRWQVKMFLDKQAGQDTIDAYQAALDEHVAAVKQA